MLSHCAAVLMLRVTVLMLLVIPGPQVAKEDVQHPVLGLQFYDVGVDDEGQPTDPLTH